MRFRGLHHIQIGIPPGGESAARAFYAEALGLAEIPKPEHLAVRGGLWFEVGGQQLHLGIEPGFRASSKAHPAFEVDDLAALRGRLESHGVGTYEDLPLAGFDRFYAHDPFGNRLEFLALKRPPGSAGGL
jgi:catechol 2,3-dioxygenase-like lactoylglutathione lyase family enzyme